MFSHGPGDPGAAPGPEMIELEPGERPAGPALRVIAWGPGQPLSGGWVRLTDRYLRFWPTWVGMEAVLPSPSTQAPRVQIARGELRRVTWKSTAVFLRRLVIEDSRRELSLLADRATLEQLARALGAEP